MSMKLYFCVNLKENLVTITMQVEKDTFNLSLSTEKKSYMEHYSLVDHLIFLFYIVNDIPFRENRSSGFTKLYPDIYSVRTYVNFEYLDLLDPETSH